MLTSRVWALLFVLLMADVMAILNCGHLTALSPASWPSQGGLDCQGISKQPTTRRSAQCWSECSQNAISNDHCRSNDNGLNAQDAFVIHSQTNSVGCTGSQMRYLCSSKSKGDGKCCDGSNPGNGGCPTTAKAEYMNMGAFDAREQYQEALAEFYYEEEVEEAREERAERMMDVKRSQLARLQSVAEQAEGRRHAGHFRKQH